MKNKIKKQIMKKLNYPCYFLITIMAMCCFSDIAHARVVDDVTITTQPDGYTVTIDFLFPLRYQSHNPDDASKEFIVQLRPVNPRSLTADQIQSLTKRSALSWDYATGIPLKELLFEGGSPDRPQLTFLFTKDVEIQAQSSPNLTSLIVKVKTDVPDVVKPSDEIAMPDEIIPQQEDLAKLMKEARTAMINWEHARAVQLYTKILMTAQGEVKKQAQELLGFARERKGQLAHAKAEYEKYLQQYPEGPDADRVRQRLAGLITAAKSPKIPTRDIRPSTRIEDKLTKWDTRFYGSLSSFYFYDQTNPEIGQRHVNRSDISNDLDFNARWRNENYDMRLQTTGSYSSSFLDQPDVKRLSNLSFEIRNRTDNWLGKIGRQSLSSGGVLGRFDGILFSKQLFPNVSINGVAGYPVESSKQTSVNTDKEFYGVSMDFGTYFDKWDFSLFYIEQQNHGITDRRAVGGEVHYFDEDKSFFNLIDYDIYFHEMNIYTLNGYWNINGKTTLNLILDYRRSPLLTMNNSIQGQMVPDLSDLFGIYTIDELKELALDRSAVSKSATIGIAQQYKDDIQLTGEITLSKLDGTPASGGVEAMRGTGTDLSFLAQSVFNNVWVENDAIITGFRYTDTDLSDTYSFNVNCRFPYKNKIRFIPKARVDYRDLKESSDNRIIVRSSLRVDYQIQKWLSFEVEGGIDWRDDTVSGQSRSTTEQFILTGFRMFF